MTHSEALRTAIAAGYTHGNSIYGYHPRKLVNMLREAERAEKIDPNSQVAWQFRETGDSMAEITNSAESEYHLCWKQTV